MPAGGWRWAKVSPMPAPHHLMMISMRPLSVGIPPPTEAKGGRCRRSLRRMRQWPHSVKNRPSEVRPQCLRGGPSCHSHCPLCRFLFALAIVVNLAQNPMMPPPPPPLAFLPDLLSLHCSIVNKILATHPLTLLPKSRPMPSMMYSSNNPIRGSPLQYIIHYARMFLVGCCEHLCQLAAIEGQVYFFVLLNSTTC